MSEMPTYRFERIHVMGGSVKDGASRWLNKWADEGWEVVAFTQNSRDNYSFVLKRLDALRPTPTRDTT